MSRNEGNQTNQYLSFSLDEEDFALEIAMVREVLDFTTITKIPQMPAFMKGVINLRGDVVPVIDMRLKLNIALKEKTADTCIIIIELIIDGEKICIGALVDSVKEVINLHADQIAPPPKIGTKLNNDFIKGMGKQNDRFLIILEVGKIFSGDELEMAKNSNSMQALPPDQTIQTESISAEVASQ